MTQLLEVEAFAAKVREYGEKTLQLIAKDVSVAIFTEVAKNVIQNTPVLTGQARNNWQSSVDAPASGLIHGGDFQRTVEGSEQDLTGAPLTGEEVAGIQRATTTFRQTAGASKLVLTNNLDYIAALDEGSSQKAPAGIVLPAIQASLAVIQDKGVVKR